MQQLSRASLLGLQSAAGNRAAVAALDRPTLARALDTTKVDPIKKETESTLTGLGMTGALEDLWNGMGVDVAQAVNHPSYRDLWFKSVNELGMDVNNATRTFRATFGADTKELTRGLASSRRDALNAFVADLDKAAAAKTSAAPQTLVEDEKAQQSRIAGERRINVRDLMDTATLVDWLRNWDELLRGVEVGTRIEQTFQPLGNPGGTPTGPASTSDPFGLTSGGSGGGPSGAQPAPQPKRTPITFTPGLTPGGTSAPGSETVIDEVRWTQLQHIYEQCQTKKDDFAGLAAALIREDANLAALDAVKDDNLMRKVGGLRGGSDAEATATIKRISKENVGKLGVLLDMLPSMDWRGLTAPQSMLLSGAQTGASKVNWAGFVERRLLEDAFARSEAAARKNAELKMYAELALTAVTFIALLSPAAPLAAAVLATADIAAGVNALTNVKDAGDADKKAGQLEAAADTGFANRADAERARKEANDRQAHIAMDLLLAAIPFIGGAGKLAGKVAKEFRAGSRFTEAASSSRGMFDAVAGIDKGPLKPWDIPTVEARATEIMKPANARLAGDGVPQLIKTVPNSKIRGASFNTATWTMEIEERLLQGEGVTVGRFNELIEYGYHETRHTFQSWQVARWRAMKLAQGETLIERFKFIVPKEIADLVTPMKAGDPYERLAQEWHASQWGHGAESREAIYRELDQSIEVMNRQASVVRKLPRTASYLERAQAENLLKLNELAYQKKFLAYRGLPEEIDANAIAGANREWATQGLDVRARARVDAAQVRVDSVNVRIASAAEELNLYRSKGVTGAGLEEAERRLEGARFDLEVAEEGLKQARIGG